MGLLQLFDFGLKAGDVFFAQFSSFGHGHSLTGRSCG
jgi:hypothetical protein